MNVGDHTHTQLKALLHRLNKTGATFAIWTASDTRRVWMLGFDQEMIQTPILEDQICEFLSPKQPIDALILNLVKLKRKNLVLERLSGPWFW